MSQRLLLVVLVSLGLAGCAANPRDKFADQMLHANGLTESAGSKPLKPSAFVFAFDRYGYLCKDLKPNGDSSLCRGIEEDKDDKKSGYESQEGLARRLQDLMDLPPDPDKAQFLLHVHGGLNTPNQGAENALNRVRYVLSESTAPTVPIVITWPSGGISSYVDHLIRVREGRRSGKLFGVLSTPLIAVSDIVKTIGKIPKSLYFQIVNSKDETMGAIYTERLAYDKQKAAEKRYPVFTSSAWKQSLDNTCEMQPDSGVPCLPGLYKKGDVTYRWSEYVKGPAGSDTDIFHVLKRAVFPLRTATGLVFHGEVASTSWKMMKRRALNLVAPVGDFDKRLCHEPIVTCQPEGSMVDASDLFRMLIDNVPQQSLTLMGHSMGAKVINQLISDSFENTAKSNKIKNIVYHASADSIENSLNVTGKLIRYADSDDAIDAPKIFNHTLNRRAELAELSFFGLVAGGSLLAHVDQLYDLPSHPLERTMGSEVNVFSSVSEIQDRISDIGEHFNFISWDRKPGCLPQTHSQMGSPAFMLTETWGVDGTRLGDDCLPYSLEDAGEI